MYFCVSTLKDIWPDDSCSPYGHVLEQTHLSSKLPVISDLPKDNISFLLREINIT